MNDLTRLVVRAAPDEHEQTLLRLVAFRVAYPEVTICNGDGYWQALIPASNGETIITRYTLRELVDKLDELLAPAGRGDIAKSDG